jgi:transposase
MALPAACHSRDLTDEKWALIEPFLPKLAPQRRSRAPAAGERAVLAGIMAIADRHGRPVAIYTHSATPHEVTLVEGCLRGDRTIDGLLADLAAGVMR